MDNLIDSRLRRRLLASASTAWLLAALPAAHAAAAGDNLPESKRTRPGLYLEARDVPAFIEKQGGPAKVLFLDVRTRAEAVYLGMANGVDALVPFVDHQELMTDWDPQRNSYRLEPVQDFVPEATRRLQEKGLDKDSVVVLMCRSGDRSSRGANRLAEAGFSRVYTVVDGFEGDLSKDGRRDVNGWRNAGLPWSYKLDRKKMYFPK